MNTQEISGNLCQNMVLLHRKSQLSYEDFAAALGVSKSLLQRLEAPVCSAVLSMLLLYWDLPEPEQRTFLGLLQAMGRPSDGWL